MNPPTERPLGRLILPVRFFTEREYAESFMDGLLYANRLGFFRSVEGDTERGDPDEGYILRDSNGLTVRNEQGQILPLEIVGGVKWDYDVTEHFNVICLTLFQSRESADEPNVELAEQVIAEVRASLPTCQTMGAHAVVIENFDEFLRRIMAATKARGYDYCSQQVIYYDPPHSPSSLSVRSRDAFDPVFYKARRFEPQKEYRIVVDTGSRGKDPITLDIGSIKDISSYRRTESLTRLRFRP